jgi:hypothetical protein
MAHLFATMLELCWLPYGLNVGVGEPPLHGQKVQDNMGLLDDLQKNLIDAQNVPSG